VRRLRQLLRTCAAAVGLLAGAPLMAQNVTLNGSMGERALLIIDGQPRTVAVGAGSHGVKLLALKDGEAQVDVGGKRLLLRIGAAPVSLGDTGMRPGGSEIVLTAGPGGHFITGGQINGKSVQFMVDTGATAVSISQAEAERIGLNYRSGTRTMANTANGAVPTHLVVLSSVRVGDVEVANVQAIVLPAQMPHVLLGNSFLTRFQFKRDNDVLRLEKKP
jgi:aspartyl protease family protein